MAIGDIAQWAVTVLIAIGLVTTFVKNGRSSRDKFTELKTIVKGIGEDISESKEKIETIVTTSSDMKTHCAGMTSQFAERLAGHDREIKELKDK